MSTQRPTQYMYSYQRTSTAVADLQLPAVGIPHPAAAIVPILYRSVPRPYMRLHEGFVPIRTYEAKVRRYSSSTTVRLERQYEYYGPVGLAVPVWARVGAPAKGCV